MQISSLHTFVEEDGTDTPPVRVTYSNGAVASGIIKVVDFIPVQDGEDTPLFLRRAEDGSNQIPGRDPIRGTSAGTVPVAPDNAIPGMHGHLSGYERLWPR